LQAEIYVVRIDFNLKGKSVERLNTQSFGSTDFYQPNVEIHDSRAAIINDDVNPPTSAQHLL
jgi:hypothetical protein